MSSLNELNYSDLFWNAIKVSYYTYRIVLYVSYRIVCIVRVDAQ